MLTFNNNINYRDYRIEDSHKWAEEILEYTKKIETNPNSTVSYVNRG
jgi:hypothetical protein